MPTDYFSKLMQEKKKEIIKNNLMCNNTCNNCSNRQRVKFIDQCKVKRKPLYTLAKTCDNYNQLVQ